MDATSFPEALSSHMILQPDSAFFFPALRPKAVLFTLRVFTTRHTRLPQECAGLNCVHAHTDPISLGSQPGFVSDGLGRVPVSKLPTSSDLTRSRTHTFFSFVDNIDYCRRVNKSLQRERAFCGTL